MPDGSLLRFNDSQFLVFINRLLSFIIALSRLLCTGQQVIAAPLYKFSYCSLTNIISAWCQYEALKYVSFPTQVITAPDFTIAFNRVNRKLLAAKLSFLVEFSCLGTHCILSSDVF